MTEAIALQEDQLRIPAAWSKLLLPRRGCDTPDVKLDPNGPHKIVERIKLHNRELDRMLALPENEPWLDDMLAYLDGEPNARGAAAVLTLIPGSGADDNLRPAIDAWVGRHGLAFAAAATVERLCCAADANRSVGHRYLHDGLGAFPHVFLNGLHQGIGVMRGLLASASDEEYAAAVAAVAPLRHEPARRMAVALLMPEEEGWTDEASHDFRRERDWGSADRLFWNWVRTSEQLAASGLTEIDTYFIGPESIAPLVDGAGAASLPILVKTLERDERPNAAERHLLLTAIAGLPGDNAMAYLLKHLHEPGVFAAASTAAAHFPVRALRHLARLDAAPERRPRYAGLASTIDTAAREHLDEAERAAVAKLIASTLAVPEADPADVPPLLVTPPWQRKGRKQKAVVEGLEAPGDTVIAWAPGEQEQWQDLDHPRYGFRKAHWWDVYIRGEDASQFNLGLLMAFGSLKSAEQVEGRWNGMPDTWPDPIILQRILARFEAKVVDRVAESAASHRDYFGVLAPIRSAAVARIAADRLRTKSSRAAAALWFDRHGADAARLLVPDVLGADKKRRENAEAALAYLHRSIGLEAIRDAAKPYGAEAFEAIDALMDTDPLDPIGVKPPKPGPWVNAAMLPQVLMAGRETALPAASIPHLATVLALGTPEFPYAGVEVVAEACDRDSLRRFSWALFEQWISVGAPSKDGWALTQLAHFADDTTVGRLTPLIRQWPGLSQHKRAITGLQVLGAIGSEAALRAIHGTSQKVKFKALKEEAGRQIEAVAVGLGLSTEQLADRLVPDFGLDDASSTVLDYGPRQFRVGFDEGLKPFVTDLDGKSLKSLPKPGAKDDEHLAAIARERFAFLKKELRTVATELVARLETAMIESREWTAAEFRRYFADHPLVRHLARRLVWMFEVDGERTAFRVAEDRTFSDAADEEIALPDGATVRLAHPITLGDQVKAWGELLADYEILQPFDQLGRPVLAFEPEELTTGRLARFEGVTVDGGRILGMTKRGWTRDAPGDGGGEAGISYRIDRDAYLMIDLEPGLYASGYVQEDQTLEKIWLVGRPDFWDRDTSPETLARFAALDPQRVSEALASLDRLAKRE